MIIDKLSGSKVRFEVTVTKELFEHALDHAFEEANQKVEVKGFRKGHTPRNVFEAKFGVESLFEEAINHAMQDTYYDAVVENNISVVAQPKINLDFNKVKRGEDFTYEVTVAVKPEIVLGDYLNLEVKRPSESATQEEIDAAINKEMTKNAEMVLKENGVLAVDDTAVFDFSGSVNGEKFEGGTSENYELLIGSGQFIPGFEEQMIGMAPESEKNVVVTFPADYHEASLAGKEAVFAVKLHEIKNRVVPTLTDEFVTELNLENVNNVAEYQAYIKADLEKGKKERSINEATNKAVELATQNASFEVPEEMIKEESDRLHETTTRQIKQYGLEFDMYLQYMGKTKEEYDADLLAQATKTIRSQLVVEAIGKKEKLEASKEEIGQKYLEIVEQYKSQNVTLEQAQAAIPETAVIDEIVFKKAVDLLVKNIRFID